MVQYIFVIGAAKTLTTDINYICNEHLTNHLHTLEWVIPTLNSFELSKMIQVNHYLLVDTFSVSVCFLSVLFCEPTVLKIQCKAKHHADKMLHTVVSMCVFIYCSLVISIGWLGREHCNFHAFMDEWIEPLSWLVFCWTDRCWLE